MTRTGGPGSSAPAAAPITLIAQRYRLLGVVGRGATGTVYRARDRSSPDRYRQESRLRLLHRGATHVYVIPLLGLRGGRSRALDLPSFVRRVLR